MGEEGSWVPGCWAGFQSCTPLPWPCRVPGPPSLGFPTSNSGSLLVAKPQRSSESEGQGRGDASSLRINIRGLLTGCPALDTAPSTISGIPQWPHHCPECRDDSREAQGGQRTTHCHIPPRARAETQTRVLSRHPAPAPPRQHPQGPGVVAVVRVCLFMLHLVLRG